VIVVSDHAADDARMGVRPWRIVRPIAGNSKGREAGTVRRYVDGRLVHAAWAQAKARRNAPPGFAPSLADLSGNELAQNLGQLAPQRLPDVLVA